MRRAPSSLLSALLPTLKLPTSPHTPREPARAAHPPRLRLLPGFLAAVLVAAISSGQASAVPILDQVNDSPGSTSAQAAYASQTWMQQVVAGVSGQLSRIDIYVNMDPTLGGQFRFFVNTGSGWQTDASEFDAIIALPPFPGPVPQSGWASIDVSSALIGLTAGDPFMFGWGGADTRYTSTTVHASVRMNTADHYGAGEVWLNGSVFLPGSAPDAMFRTYMTVVPEPGSLLLLVAGLVGVTGASRIRASGGPSGSR